MRREAGVFLIAGVIASAACLGAYPAAACFRHTFEACSPDVTPNYAVKLDCKAGGTRLKEQPPDKRNIEEMARLAAAAKKLAVRPVASPLAPQEPGGWQTRVEARAASAPRQN